MTNPFLSEIRMMSFAFPPKGWALCNGQTLSIQQNAALFALIGTTYGGNGVTNFQLPNLQGNVPLGQGTSFRGNSYTLGVAAGEVQHTLAVGEMPQHTHLMAASATTGLANTAPGPTTYLAQGQATDTNKSPVNIYSTAGPTGVSGAIASTGGNQPHPNQQPYEVISFCIALIGIFPSRS
jgi:microcystin-dependent protein